MFGITFDSKITFETQLREVDSTHLGVWVSCAVQGSYLIVHVYSRAVSLHIFLLNLNYCTSVWMSSAESHLCLLDSVIRSAEMLYEDKHCCKGHALCLLFSKHKFCSIADTEGRSVPCACSIANTEGRSVPCVCSIRFLSE